MRVFLREHAGEKDAEGLRSVSRSDPYVQGLAEHTSSALEVALVFPAFSVATALEKSSLVMGSNCNTSVGLNSSSVVLSDARSGRNRKNSFQKPSDFSSSMSSYFARIT